MFVISITLPAQELYSLPIVNLAFFFLSFFTSLCSSSYHLRVLVDSFTWEITFGQFSCHGADIIFQDLKVKSYPFLQLYCDTVYQYKNVHKSETAGTFCMGTTFLDYTLSFLVTYQKSKNQLVSLISNFINFIFQNLSVFCLEFKFVLELNSPENAFILLLVYIKLHIDVLKWDYTIQQAVCHKSSQ